MVVVEVGVRAKEVGGSDGRVDDYSKDPNERQLGADLVESA